MTPKERVRSMDTLRSMAILMVLLAHTVLGYGAPAGLAPIQLGGMGVDLFFVLSGWLLGGQLFKEMERGSINIKRFWVRRWMRTLPAYYAVLLFTMGQQVLTKDDPATPWTFFFFIQNYHYPLEIFSVSWSLAVEEQFYLFIAPFLAITIFLQRSYRLTFLLIIFLMPSLFRYLEWYGTTAETHVRLDGCMIGVILAALKYQHDTIWRFLIRFSGVLALISLVFFVLFFYQRWYPVSWLSDPGYFVRSLMFGSWVLYANSSSVAKWKISFPGAYYIATRSYAIYLLHPDAIAITNRLVLEVNFLIYALFVFFISIVLSEALYRLVEVPFMMIRNKVRLAN